MTDDQPPLTDVLNELSNEYRLDILESTDEPKTTQELADELDIPTITAHRCVRNLTEYDLLECVGHVRTENGAPPAQYQRCVSELAIVFGEVDTIVIDTRGETAEAADD